VCPYRETTHLDDQRARAAFRAIARRRAGESRCMRVAALFAPPNRPSATAAGFFVRVVFVLDRLSIGRVSYHRLKQGGASGAASPLRRVTMPPGEGMTDNERFELDQQLRDEYRSARADLSRQRQQVQRLGTFLKDLGYRVLTEPDAITPADTRDLPAADTIDRLLADIRRLNDLIVQLRQDLRDRGLAE
jgi:hypothetical protein